jgi:hypothetical protein
MINKILSVFFIVSLMLFVTPAYAQEIRVDDIDINPSSPDRGETIEIKSDFVVDSDTTNEVKLELYIDGQLEDTYTNNYPDGVYSYTFKLDTDELDKGGHTARIKARIYENNIVEDSDSESETFDVDIKQKGELELIGITPEEIDTGKKITIHIKMENIGDEKVDNIKAWLFEKDEGIEIVDEYDTLSSICEDCKGTLDFKIKATSSGKNKRMKLKVKYHRDEDTVTRYFYPEIDVKGIGGKVEDATNGEIALSMNIYPAKINPDEWVHIDGFARIGSMAIENPISIYKDDVYIGSVTAESSGYYSTYVKFTNIGLHVIKLNVGGIEETRYARVEKESTEKVEGKLGTVSVDISNTEIDLPKKGTNLLRITVNNNLGRAELFGLGGDFENVEFFVPHDEIIEEGESKIFSVYFGPVNEPGRYNGVISVTQSDEVIKEVPVSLYVSSFEEAKKVGLFSIFKIFAPFALGIIVVVFIIILIIMRINKSSFQRISRPLEPSIVTKGPRTLRDKILSAPYKEKSYDSYHVPEDHVIY